MLGIDLDDSNIIDMKYLYYMMNINFYVKSMKNFIILSVMWYERLTKCYLLHIDPSEFRELGKTCQTTCFPLSTLNHLSFTEHASWLSQPRLPKFSQWDSWAWIMSQKMRWYAMSLDYGFWWLFSVDMAQVANEIKPCGVKNLSLTTITKNLVIFSITRNLSLKTIVTKYV